MEDKAQVEAKKAGKTRNVLNIIYECIVRLEKEGRRGRRRIGG